MDWTAVERGFREYLLTSGSSEATAKTYASNLHGFYTWCTRHECLPHDVDRLVVREWLTSRKESVSSQRAHNDLAALRKFYALLREDRYRDDDPTENLRVKRAQRLPTEPLAHDDLQKMLCECKDERDRLMLLVMASTALRISELASIHAEHIDWARGEIRIVGKGDKERRVNPPAEVIGRLHAYCGMFPAGPLWLSKVQRRALSAQQIRKIIYEIAARAKVEHVHPHRLRAYFATEFMEQKGDIQALQQIMGHSSITTTAGYSQYTREKRAREMNRSFDLRGIA